MVPRSRRMRAARIVVAAAVAAVGASCTVLNPLDRYQAGLGEATPRTDGATGDDGGLAPDGGGTLQDGGPIPRRCDPAQPFGDPISVDELNTPSSEDMISDVSPDELTIYFGTNRDGPGVRLYSATRSSPNAKWDKPEPLFEPGAWDDWSITIAPRGLIAVLASGPGRPKGVGGVDLFVATRDNTFAKFATPSPTTGTNTAFDEQAPHWTLDGTALYFDRTTEDGGRELLRSPVNGVSFGNAERLAELDTSSFNAAAVLSKDELSIYFSSNRPSATGSASIFVATRSKKSDLFSAPKIVPRINSTGLDAPGYLTEDGCRLYFGSTRTGSFDIFVAQRPP